MALVDLLNALSRQLVILAVLAVLPGMAVSGQTADHQQFEALHGEFTDIKQINEACIGCHNLAESQLHDTIHWQWDYPLDDGEHYGKLNVINNYHPNVVSNTQACGSCHIGYGLPKRITDEIPNASVDCIACHDTTGEYFNFRFHQDGAECSMCHDDGAAALKQKVDLEGSRFSLTLTEIAQRVGETSVASCGSCHFYDGGGDGAKHGDLDSALIRATFEQDVHMSSEGSGLTCSSCHQANEHQLFGSRYEASSPSDVNGVNATQGARATCVSCHGDRPMKDDKLNDHTDVIACQTCHIPSYARNGIATKTFWDWSKAGELDRKKRPTADYDDAGRIIYSSQKGQLSYGENLAPSYDWFDGTMEYSSVGSSVSDGVTLINEPKGGARKNGAKIFPFHEFNSMLPFDTQNQTLLPMHLSSRSRSAFWNGYDWDKSLSVAAKEAGVDFSGDYGFTETKMYWSLNHTVAPKEQALQCENCHAQDGVLKNVAGVYIPGSAQLSWLDRFGVLALVLTLLGVLAHGGLRLLLAYRRNRK